MKLHNRHKDSKKQRNTRKNICLKPDGHGAPHFLLNSWNSCKKFVSIILQKWPVGTAATADAAVGAPTNRKMGNGNFRF